MGNEGVAPFYEGWRKQNGRLVDGIRSLSDEQLKLRAARTSGRCGRSPRTPPVPASIGYAACSRESGAESTPSTDPASGYGWEDDESRPRGSGEIVLALESSWAIVDRCLATRTTSMLNDEFRRDIRGKTQVHTRQSVLVRMITHDAYHSGEISQILGANGLPAIDLWRAG